jgi:hypothetical protein
MSGYRRCPKCGAVLRMVGNKGKRKCIDANCDYEEGGT